MSQDPDKHIYDKLRELLGGRLPQAQFEAAKKIIASGFREDFRISLGLSPNQADDQTTSIKGQLFIKGYEALRLTAYKPVPTDPWTIGWGSTKGLDGKPIPAGTKITEAVASQLFSRDLKYFENIVNEVITVPLTQNQFDALVSFVYNNGETNFIKGTVDDLINAGKWDEAYKKWGQYINSGGKPLEGLRKRRQAEIALAKS
jgi:lysozyme